MSAVLRHLSLITFLLLGNAPAAPYGPQGLAIDWKIPGGAKHSLRVFGDEFHARTETHDGYTVVFDPTAQNYFYATLSADGRDLVPTAMALGKGNPATFGLPRHLAISPESAKLKALARYDQWNQTTENSVRWNALKATQNAIEKAPAKDSPEFSPPSSPTLGTKVGLTLLIDFDDDPAAVPQANIIDFCNGDNYTGYGNNGSVKKYYLDNSNNALTYTNVVTAYIRIPNSLHPKSYYNNTTKDCGAQGNLLIKDAIAIMKALPNYATEILPTFSTVSVDGSNNILACNVFYAGGNGGVWSYGLWPHSWALYNVGAQALSSGGKKVYRYQITNIGASLELGTFCHENGHMLCGYPDIYDYGYDSVGGAGGFCLMNSGGHGTNPVLICAYLKRASGWTTVTDLTSGSNVAATLVATPGTAGYNNIYRYAKPGVATEYFLFENRRKTGRDANIAASGVAIWHVDELGNKDNQSMVPNSNHANYEVTLVQADNLWHFESNSNSGDSKDLYYSGNTAAAYTNVFSDTSAPNAHWWDGSNSNCYAASFSTAAVSMTLQFGINMPPNTIIVRSPNGGGNIYFGSTQTITWDSNITGNVKLDLYKGGVLQAVLAANEANDGSYPWVVSAGLPAGNDYTVKISSVANPAYTDSSDAVFTLMTQPTLADALDTSGLVWTTGGTSNWYPQLLTTHDGVDAAQSGILADSQSNFLQTTVTGPGTLTFWWKISSESNYDYLRFYLDGVEQSGITAISGEVAWGQKSLSIPTGSHILKWEYAKDYSVASGADAAWVDQVVYTPATNPEIAVEQPVGTGLSDGTSSVNCEPANLGSSAPALTFTVKNTGTANLTGLALSKDGTHHTDFTLGSLGTTTLPPGASTTFSVTFTPGAAGARTAAIHLASNDADENPFDIALTGTGVGVPEIAVEQPAGTGLSDGTSSVDCGPANPGSSAAAVTFTVKNTGTANLTGLALSKDGAHPTDFALGSLGATTLAPGASTTFSVTFTPGAAGARTAAIHLASNDADENPFDIALTGTGRTPLESWRFTHFGTSDNTGPGANDMDSDGDRYPNLMEYAFGLNPGACDPNPLQIEESSTSMAILYPVNLAASDVAITYEESTDMGTSDPWSPATVTEEPVGPPVNGVQWIRATHPLTPDVARSFLHLKISPNP